MKPTKRLKKGEEKNLKGNEKGHPLSSYENKSSEKENSGTRKRRKHSRGKGNKLIQSTRMGGELLGGKRNPGLGGSLSSAKP